MDASIKSLYYQAIFKKNPGAEAPGCERVNRSYWSAWAGVSVLKEQAGFVPTFAQV